MNIEKFLPHGLKKIKYIGNKKIKNKKFIKISDTKKLSYCPSFLLVDLRKLENQKEILSILRERRYWMTFSWYNPYLSRVLSDFSTFYVNKEGLECDEKDAFYIVIFNI